MPRFRKKKMPGDRRIRSCFNLLQRGSDKKRFQYCLGFDGLVVYLRAIQGLSKGTMVDLALVDNVDMPYGGSEYIHHVGCSMCPSSRTNGSWKRCERRTAKSLCYIRWEERELSLVIATCWNQESEAVVRGVLVVVNGAPVLGHSSTRLAILTQCRAVVCRQTSGRSGNTALQGAPCGKVKKNHCRKVEVHLRPGPTSTVLKGWPSPWITCIT